MIIYKIIHVYYINKSHDSLKNSHNQNYTWMIYSVHKPTLTFVIWYLSICPSGCLSLNFCDLVFNFCVLYLSIWLFELCFCQTQLQNAAPCSVFCSDYLCVTFCFNLKPTYVWYILGFLIVYYYYYYYFLGFVLLWNLVFSSSLACCPVLQLD